MVTELNGHVRMVWGTVGGNCEITLSEIPDASSKLRGGKGKGPLWSDSDHSTCISKVTSVIAFHEF